MSSWIYQIPQGVTTEQWHTTHSDHSVWSNDPTASIWVICWLKIIEFQNEPPHDKLNRMACAQSDQSLCCPHEETLGP